MKKFIGGLLVLVLAICSLTMFTACNNSSKTADKGENPGAVYSVEKDEDGKKYAVLKKYNLSDEDAEKVAAGNYSDAMIELVINEYEYEGVKLPVKEIAEDAFANQVIIKKVTFGENVETIGKGCFAGCENLKEIVTPFIGKTKDAVNAEKILGFWFGTAEVANCTSTVMLYNVGSSDSMTCFLPNALKKITVKSETISDYAFYGSAIEEVILNDTVNIGAYAFSGMSALTKIKLPSSLKVIGKNAFANTASLYNVDFSSATSLETIWQEAFSGCSMLGYNSTSLVLPSSLKNLYFGAFKNCSSLKSVDISATQLTNVPTGCFYGCEKLSTLKCKTAVTFSNDAVPEETVIEKI